MTPFAFEQNVLCKSSLRAVEGHALRVFIEILIFVFESSFCFIFCAISEKNKTFESHVR